MNTTNVSTMEPQLKPIDIARNQLHAMEAQFKLALPAHIPAERFARVVMTAIQNNAKLLACDRASLWSACMKAAQDGLLPDGRDGAIVPYNEDDEGSKNKTARWMPMIAGIRKKARNSGELRDWYAYVVYAGDEFDYQLGDDPRLQHKPVPPSQRTATEPYGGIICAYSIAVDKDGNRFAPEVMWIEDIEDVREKSKAKRGPWSDPAFYPEMCRKTVARRHAKSLPMSSDLDDLIRRDDDLYDLDGAKAEHQARNGGRAQSLSTALDNLAQLPSPANAQPADPPGATIEATAEPERSQQQQRPDPPTKLGLAALEAGLKDAIDSNGILKFLRENQEHIESLNNQNRKLFDTAVIKHRDALKQRETD